MDVETATIFWMHVVVAEDVLYLRPTRLLLFHPAVAIPWAAIRQAATGSREPASVVRLAVTTRAGDVAVAVSGARVVDAVRTHLAPRLAMEAQIGDTHN